MIILVELLSKCNFDTIFTMKCGFFRNGQDSFSQIFCSPAIWRLLDILVKMKNDFVVNKPIVRKPKYLSKKGFYIYTQHKQAHEVTSVELPS